MKKFKTFTLLLIPAVISLVLFTRFMKGRYTAYLPFGACRDCNVILLNLDTLRAKSLPCYGYAKNTAPFMCNLAEKSYLFKNSYSQSAFTLDSAASIFTSTYPSSHRMLTPFEDVLNEDIKTIPEILKKNGYTNAYTGYLDDPNVPLDKGFGRDFDNFRNTGPENWSSIIGTPENPGRFFAYFHTYYNHAPYLPDRENFSRFYSKPVPDLFVTGQELCLKTLEKFRSQFPGQATLIDTGGNVDETCQKLNKTVKKYFTFDAQEYRDYFRLRSETFWDFSSRLENGQKEEYRKALYDGTIYELDRNLEAFFDHLDYEGLLKNTLVIITSVHGESFNEHGTSTHAYNLYGEVIRVPLIVYVPGAKPQVFESPVQGMDIFPTILYLLGIKDEEAQKQFTGINLFSGKEHEYVLSQHFGNRKYALTGREWKLIINNDNPDGKKTRELYNLAADPEEKDNLAGKNPEIAARMEEKINQILDNQPDYPKQTQPFPTWISPDQRKNLIETGYF